ncbi:MAG: hypothetical protein ABSC01_07345 [Verrucomicrobiota bacterium]|jgi:hypothetical protein
MNTKRTIPPIVALLPFLLFIGAVFLVVKWIFSGKKNTETMPETTPASAETESRRKEAETSAFRHIPAEIPVKPTIVSIHGLALIFWTEISGGYSWQLILSKSTGD